MLLSERRELRALVFERDPPMLRGRPPVEELIPNQYQIVAMAYEQDLEHRIYQGLPVNVCWWRRITRVAKAMRQTA